MALAVTENVYFNTGKSYILSSVIHDQTDLKYSSIPLLLFQGEIPKTEENKSKLKDYSQGEIDSNGKFTFRNIEHLYSKKDGKVVRLEFKNGFLEPEKFDGKRKEAKLINRFVKENKDKFEEFEKLNQFKEQEIDNDKEPKDTSTTPDVNLNGQHYTYIPDEKAYFYVDDNVEGLKKAKIDKNGKIHIGLPSYKFITPLDEKKIKTTEILKQLKNTIESVSSTNLEKKKAKRKYDKKLKEYKFYDNIRNVDKSYIEPVEKQSYIPQKFIPLFLQGPDGTYHKITNEEIEALKNDPTGDYYDGSGNKYILYNPETLEDNYSSDDVKIFDDSIKESKMFIPETLNKYIEDLFENDDPNDIKKYKKVMITINKGSGLFDPLSRLVMQGVDSMKSQWNLLKSFGSMIKRKIIGHGINKSGGFNLLGLITPIGDFIYNIKKKVDTALTNKFNAMGCQRKSLVGVELAKETENKQGKGSNIPPYKASGVYYNQQTLPKDSSINYKMSIDSLRARPSAPGMPGW